MCIIYNPQRFKGFFALAQSDDLHPPIPCELLAKFATPKQASTAGKRIKCLSMLCIQVKLHLDHSLPQQTVAHVKPSHGVLHLSDCDIWVSQLSASGSLLIVGFWV